MSARLLEGAPVAEALCVQTREQADALIAAGITPTLGIVRIGERPDDLSYERGAYKRAEQVGVAVQEIALPETASIEETCAALGKLDADPAIHGILTFRPFPAHIDTALVDQTLSIGKDVDASTDASLGGLLTGHTPGFAPCTAQACIEICDHYGIELEGKRVVVIGRSLIIGKPLALLLLDRNATVTIAHSHTQDLATLTRQADIIVACVGHAHMLDASYVVPGQTVIDAGINFTDEGELVGDVAFEQAAGIVAALTPVPGGVGSVTSSVVCKHVVQAALRSATAQLG